MLNNEQAEMVSDVLATSGGNVCKPISTIQGPPGTGKTSWIIAVISALFWMQGRPRILVSAPSNAAIDELVGRIVKDGLLPSNESTESTLPSECDLVRLGADSKVRLDVQADIRKLPNRPSSTTGGGHRRGAGVSRSDLGGAVIVPGASLSFRATAPASAVARPSLVDSGRTSCSSWRSRGDRIRQARIVCVTLSGCGMLSLSDEFFDVVIVDEAAQVRSSGCAFKPTVVDVVL